jgi:glucose/mannose transport system permease protein
VQFTTQEFRRYTARVTLYVVLLLATAFFLTPIYVVVITALKEPSEINVASTWTPPTKLYWQSFTEVIDVYGPRIWNSLTIVHSSTLISAVLGSLNGYIFSKWRVPGERFLFPLLLFGMFIPYQAILIPLFEFLRDIPSVWGNSRFDLDPRSLWSADHDLNFSELLY